MNLYKNSVAIHLSNEYLFIHRALFDSRYQRRIEKIITTQPTEVDWTEYRKAKAAHDYLLASPYFDDGGPDEGSSVSEPTPYREIVYAETVDEWGARCHEIEKERE